MKIVVLSDSHTDVDTMHTVVRRAHPDYVFHLGDHARDAESLQQLVDVPVAVVRGNTDYDTLYPEFRVFELYGKRFFLTHGHRHHVKIGLDNLIYRAIASQVDIVLFGHTHVPYLQLIDGIWLMNPGRIGRLENRATEVSFGVVSCLFLILNAQKLSIFC